MGTHQFRRSVSLSVEDFLLLRKLNDRLGGSRAGLVSLLVRREAKKQGLFVTDLEIDDFKHDVRDRRTRESNRRF